MEYVDKEIRKKIQIEHERIFSTKLFQILLIHLDTIRSSGVDDFNIRMLKSKKLHNYFVDEDKNVNKDY